MPAGRRRTAFWLAREQDSDAGKHQHHANHRKGVAETHHQRVPLDGVAERNDRLLMCVAGSLTPCARKKLVI